MTTGLTLPSRNEQSMWIGKLTSKQLIAHATPNTTHVLVYHLGIPDDEQVIFCYGNDTNDGFLSEWSETVKVKDHPEIAEVWANGNWQTAELEFWLGGPPNQVAPNLNFHHLYNIPESLDMESIYQQYILRFIKERGAGAIPPHNQPMLRPEFWNSYALVLEWLESADDNYINRNAENVTYHISKMLMNFHDIEGK